MLERFTERARRALVLAHEEAGILKHNYVGTEHILLGLLREEGAAGQVLESLDITEERVRAQVVRIVGAGEGSVSGEIPFTPRAKKVLEEAVREALSLRDACIEPEHILLGVVREGEGVAARILLDFDAYPGEIRKRVLWKPAGGWPLQPPPGPPPKLDLDRRHQALHRPDEIREARTRLRRELRQGRVKFADVVRSPAPEVATAKVADLLLAAPKFGRVRVQRALNHARISPSKTVGGLSERQRRDLLEWLDR